MVEAVAAHGDTARLARLADSLQRVGAASAFGRDRRLHHHARGLLLLARGDSVTQQELVRRASSDPNTVRAMLVLLEKRGLVARVGHPTDGRARNVSLTR